MPTTWEIDENAPPEEPPAESLVADPNAGELTPEDLDVPGDVVLAAEANGEAS